MKTGARFDPFLLPVERHFPHVASTVAARQETAASASADLHVGAIPHGVELRELSAPDLAALTDEALEARIAALGTALVRAQAELDAHGGFGDMAERDRLWVLERAALRERARRPGVVAAMEIQRGIA
jgi:hypothetical protein